MIVHNETPLPAAFVPNADDEDQIVGLFLVAMTCAVDGKTSLSLTREQRPLRLTAEEEMVPDDAQFFREGVSVTASGFVYMPGGRGTTADASLRIGDVVRRVRAYGPRVWQSGLAGGVVPSSPLPTDRVEMVWDNAFGGMYPVEARLEQHEGETLIVPAHPVGYPLNMSGKGFFLEAERAVDQPLPLLEDPDQPVTRPDDRPEPVCFAPYPLHGGLRAAFVLDPEDKKADLSRMRRVTSRACPRLWFPEVPVGTKLRLEGMCPDGAVIEFAVPEPPAEVDVVIGRASQRVALELDAIDIDAEARTVRFVYRRLFRYGLVQYEERLARFQSSPTLQSMEMQSTERPS